MAGGLRQANFTLPEALLEANRESVVTIPMHGTRSLNLATAVAIVLFEGERQLRAETGN